MKNPLRILLNITRRFSIKGKPKRRFRLPSIRFPHIPFPHIPFRFIRTVLRKTLALMLLLISGVGFYVLVAKPWPMPLIHGYFPILGLESTQFYGWLRELYTEDVIWRSAIGTMSFALVASLILLVQRPMSALVGLYRGIKASPMALLRSPITFYRRVVKVRNWILEKVDYLNSESAKWKTTFNIMKSPYSLLRTLGFSPNMALGLLFAGSTVGGGVLVTETILAERSFSAGDPGVYQAPHDIPISYISDPEQDGYNTLRVDLGATPVRAITVENTSLNRHTGSALPSGQQNVLEVGGNAASNGFTATRLVVGVLIFENNRCKSLELSDIQTHKLVIDGNSADGMSIAPTAASGAANRRMAVGGGNHSAAEMGHAGGLFDRLWISSNSSGVNGSVDRLTLKNISSKGGPCKLSRINASEIHILLNTIGHDSNLATKEFTVATNVTAAVIEVNNNIEMNVTEPATQ